MWQGIRGHDEIVERFRRILAAGRLASTYLFVGPPGIGKRRFALELARSLLCTQTPHDALAACGECESCRLLTAGAHPDFKLVALRPDKSELAISQFIGFDDEANEPALCPWMALKPYFGGRRIAVVDDADHFNLHSANCLLKTLEEPPPNSLLILIGTSPARQLPTIRSRSQIVRFQPLDPQTIAHILIEAGLCEDRQQALRAAELGAGSVEQALQSADAELWQFRQQLRSQLAPTRLDQVRLARAVMAFSDEAGKESARRRQRLRLVLGFAAEFYRERLRSDDDEQRSAAVQALDATLSALEYLDRNVNQASLITWWTSSLARSGSAEPQLSHLP